MDSVTGPRLSDFTIDQLSCFMGFTGQVAPALVCCGHSDTRSRLARWINAPSTGLELIRENIMRNHHVRCNENSILIPVR
jgi:hypothetical protein